jgi:hypothetical protein
VIWLYAVVAAAGLVIIAFGVLDASPLVNFGTAEELAAVAVPVGE